MGAVENVFENEGLACAEPDHPAPLDAKTPSPGDLESVIFQAPPKPITFFAHSCPFCPSPFGTCSHSTGVPPIVKEHE